MIRLKKNEYKYRIACIYSKNYPSLKMFKADMLLYSGDLFKLPHINGAGVLANNCYFYPIENGFELYHMNGYLQLFYREVNGICEVNNDWMPFEYTKCVLEYLKTRK